ncbi:hypothetical protein [Streptomyces sp. SID3212]|uniref:hypothetical protein n=1 Tax=unclassified Streptomyces TaxID=2593676 RepID=UPI00136EC975|nr:hypothetical protein [Streptomyces sp. SID3212]MYV57246.1 hypothetical protein [Streptomyces sp. SID3212]
MTNEQICAGPVEPSKAERALTVVTVVAGVLMLVGTIAAISVVALLSYGLD